MKKALNKEIDEGHSILDEINMQLSDIKNYAENIDECVIIIGKCLSEINKKGDDNE